MKRHALFVGVSKHSDPTIQNLAYPEEDATELASVFRRLLKFDRVEKLTNPAHAPEVVDAIKDMTRGLGTGDLFLFFFAGHGFRVKENHVLVCAKDEFADLEDEYAGLPVGQLKKRMRGPWNRMLILDACQNDIRATRGADTGATKRDIALIHEVERSSSESGYQIVLTACSEGQKALEVSDLGHGLFTSAFLDSVTSFVDARRRLDLESLRVDLGKRMNRLIAQYRLSGRQEPLFTMPADAGGIILLDCVESMPSAPQPPLSYHQHTAAPALVVCPVCGKKNRPEDTFKCRECGRDNLCLRHQDDKTFLCINCADAQRKARKIEPKTLPQLLGTVRHSRSQQQSVSAEEANEKGDNFHYGRNGYAQSYADAVSWYCFAAEQGYATAQCNLGFMYNKGRGVEQDYEEAVKWFRKAAEQGDADAQCILGVMYAKGRGVERDDEEAVKWYRKAAEQGYADAQDKLGWMYENGWGICRDYAQAAAWYRKAAEQGNDLAQNSLGRMYENGWGVPQSNDKAVEWYRKAADKGNKDACHKYGDILFLGLLGVEKNVTAAFTYFQKADLADPWIQYDIGECHRLFYTEKGNEEDARAAVEWLQKSATAGVPWACVKMGDCYRDGIGVTRNLICSRDWYHHASDPVGLEKFGDFEATYWAKRGLAEVSQELLEQQIAPTLNQHWESFRLVSGVRVRDKKGRDVPIAGLVASDRGIFIGVTPYAIGLDESAPLPKENPAWPFAESVSQHCGIPLEYFLAALIIPKESCVSDLGLPFWALRESNLSTVMLNARASKSPDWQAKRQKIIRRLETLPMSSKGAEKSLLFILQLQFQNGRMERHFLQR